MPIFLTPQPLEVSFIPLPQWANNIEVADGYAYVVSGGGLYIFDVTNPAAPIQAGHYLAPGGPVRQLAGQDNYIYLSSENNLNVIDISDPAFPVQISAYAAPQEIGDVKIQGNYLYLTEESCLNDGCKGKLHLLDISDPISLTEISSYDPSGRAVNITVAGNYAYINSDGLLILDISNPAAPRQVAYSDALSGIIAAVVGNYAYAIWDGLHVLDISNPAAPVEVALQPGRDLDRVATVTGNFAYVAKGTSGFQVIDISNPLAPVEVSSVEKLGDEEPFSVEDMTVAGDKLYLATGSDGLRVFDISAPTQPVEISFFTSTLGDAEEVVVRNIIYVSYGLDGLYIFQATH